MRLTTETHGGTEEASNEECEITSMQLADALLLAPPWRGGKAREWGAGEWSQKNRTPFGKTICSKTILPLGGGKRPSADVVCI